MPPKIHNFTDLKAWQSAHKLTLTIYTITKQFPKHEQYALTSQIRRAAISVSSNIAEGFSRLSKNEKIQFYSIAKGSLTELQNQALLSRDLGYINNKNFQHIASLSIKISKLLTGLIQSTKKMSK